MEAPSFRGNLEVLENSEVQEDNKLFTRINPDEFIYNIIDR